MNGLQLNGGDEYRMPVCPCVQESSNFANHIYFTQR